MMVPDQGRFEVEPGAETQRVHTFLNLIATEDLPALGPKPRRGRLAVAAVRERVDEWLLRYPSRRGVAALLQSAALLWHDHLDLSHQISQGIADAHGSLLHGIMHRREPDYGNAAYWFRRVGKHPSFPEIADQVRLLCADHPEECPRFLTGGGWDPFVFIQAVEKVESGDGGERESPLLRQIQRIEFNAVVGSILRLP